GIRDKLVTGVQTCALPIYPLPPGVTVVGGKSKTLLGTGSKGHPVLKCAPNAAPIENVPISVLAHVSINFVVKVSYSSQPIMVSRSEERRVGKEGRPRWAPE